MKKVVKRVLLNVMPFDRWDDDKHTHIHATGYICEFDDGTIETEYEDSDFIDAENVVFEEE